MPRAVILRALAGLGLSVGLALLVLWALGGIAALESWAMAGQRQFQSELAAVLRRLRAGEAGALAALMGVAFAYGVLHAAGPGHGKVVIGGYGVARRVPLLRLSVIALAAALMQGTVAVALVYGGIGVMGWTRAQIGGIEKQVFVPIGQVLIAGIGLWLIWRGLIGLRRSLRPQVCAPKGPGLFAAYHDSPKAADTCPDCGHRHGPTLAEVQAVTGWKDAVILISGIGIRPCSGALMLLVLTWQIGLGAAGVAGAYAMALGTGAVTVLVAALAVWAREGGRTSLAGLSRWRWLGAVLELAVGGVILAVAFTVLSRAG